MAGKARSHFRENSLLLSLIPPPTPPRLLLWKHLAQEGPLPGPRGGAESLPQLLLWDVTICSGQSSWPCFPIGREALKSPQAWGRNRPPPPPGTGGTSGEMAPDLLTFALASAHLASFLGPAPALPFAKSLWPQGWGLPQLDLGSVFGNYLPFLGPSEPCFAIYLPWCRLLCLEPGCIFPPLT